MERIREVKVEQRVETVMRQTHSPFARKAVQSPFIVFAHVIIIGYVDIVVDLELPVCPVITVQVTATLAQVATLPTVVQPYVAVGAVR
jgi:hypothetical protein